MSRPFQWTSTGWHWSGEEWEELKREVDGRGICHIVEGFYKKDGSDRIRVATCRHDHLRVVVGICKGKALFSARVIMSVFQFSLFSEQQRAGETPSQWGKTPAFGSQTPMVGSTTPSYGSMTPMHGGGRTPMYGSQTPLHDGED